MTQDMTNRQHSGDKGADSGLLEKRLVLLDLAGTVYHLKKTLMNDVGFFEHDFVYKAGLEGAKESLKEMNIKGVPKNPRKTMETLLEVMKERGYGTFRIAEFDSEKSFASLVSRDSAEAWAFQKNADLQRAPVCSYTSGVLSVICQFSFVGDTSDKITFKAHETECVGNGHEECIFSVGPVEEINKRHPDAESPKETVAEHELRLNEEILSRNLELQGLNLELERQVRKRTEDLWRSEENYESLMRLSPDPIAVITISGRINSINPAGLKMFGFEQSEETTDLNITSLLTDKNNAWEKVLWLIDKEGHVSGLELNLTRRDGKMLSGQLNARYADMPTGRCVEAVFKDVTEKKEMEEQVREARSETEFLNDLHSHDIINYTMSALHFLQGALKIPDLTPEAKSKLVVATRDMQNAFNLASSVRDLARAKEEGEEPPEEVKDLQLLVAEAIEDSKAMYFDRRMRFNFQKTTEPKYVAAGSIASRLFTNLLTNAIKYDQHDEVVVDISIEPVSESGASFWQVRVSDNGVGIPDEDKERVFERFERGKTSIRGTGLGLFVSRSIADAYKGKVWAENRVHGDHTKGTTMIVRLPKADEKKVGQLRTKMTKT